MEVSGLAKRTVQRWLRWLEGHGLVEVLEEGTTPQFRPAILARGTGNLAREWLLSRPVDNPVNENGTPPSVSSSNGFPARARARKPVDKPPPASTPLADITEGWQAHLTRPFLEAGWTQADLQFAVDHEPGGRQHRYDLATVRHPVGWLRFRLGLWLGADDKPLPSRSQQAGEYRRQVLAGQAERRASRSRARQQAATVDVTARVAELHAIVTEVRMRRQRSPGAGKL